jgi:3-deoxy-7-phosphoheptulonate synthase
LRGGKAPNYDVDSVTAACAEIEKAGLPGRVMIDASHANSAKKPERQPLVIDDIAARVADGDRRVIGVMIESHLVGGRQDLVPGKPLVYGQSITDACLAWDASVVSLERLAEAVRARRVRSVAA